MFGSVKTATSGPSAHWRVGLLMIRFSEPRYRRPPPPPEIASPWLAIDATASLPEEEEGGEGGREGGRDG